MTDEAGEFEFIHLAPNTYRIGLFLKRSSTADRDEAIWLGADNVPLEVTVGTEERIWTSEFGLPSSLRLVRIQGLVVDAAEKPVAGARVYVLRAQQFEWLGEPVVTGSSGAFAFTVRAGTEFKLTADQFIPPKGARSAETGPLRADADAPPIRLRFDR